MLFGPTRPHRNVRNTDDAHQRLEKFPATTGAIHAMVWTSTNHPLHICRDDGRLDIQIVLGHPGGNADHCASALAVCLLSGFALGGICLCRSDLPFQSFDRRGWHVWTIALALLAVIFNPVLPAHLTRSVWWVFNVLGALLLIAHLCAEQKTQLAVAGVRIETPGTTNVDGAEGKERCRSPTSSSPETRAQSVADYGATFRGRKRDALSGRRMREIARTLRRAATGNEAMTWIEAPAMPDNEATRHTVFGGRASRELKIRAARLVLDGVLLRPRAFFAPRGGALQTRPAPPLCQQMQCPQQDQTFRRDPLSKRADQA